MYFEYDFFILMMGSHIDVLASYDETRRVVPAHYYELQLGFGHLT